MYHGVIALSTINHVSNTLDERPARWNALRWISPWRPPFFVYLLAWRRVVDVLSARRKKIQGHNRNETTERREQMANVREKQRVRGNEIEGTLFLLYLMAGIALNFSSCPASVPSSVPKVHCWNYRFIETALVHLNLIIPTFRFVQIKNCWFNTGFSNKNRIMYCLE